MYGSATASNNHFGSSPSLLGLVTTAPSHNPTTSAPPFNAADHCCPQPAADLLPRDLPPPPPSTLHPSPPSPPILTPQPHPHPSPPQALLDEREPDVLRAFTALEMDAAGRLAPHDIQHSLRKLGLPAGEDECRAMLAAVGGAEDGFVSYGRFRAFAALLPPAAARSPSSLHTAWFESATMVPIGPPSQAPVGDVRTISPRTVLIAALAGAMASRCVIICCYLCTGLRLPPSGTDHVVSRVTLSLSAREKPTLATIGTSHVQSSVKHVCIWY